MSDEPRKHRLIVEAELPSFYADGLISLMDEHAWPPFDAMQPTEKLLSEIGDLRSGLLTIQVAGEKDSAVEENVPVLFRRAWIETEPPSAVPDWGVVEHVRERNEERVSQLAFAEAHAKALVAFLRKRLPDEWSDADRAAIDIACDASDKALAAMQPRPQ